MNKIRFITGIGTSVGKTVVSAILCRLWKYSYWKPVQAGDLNASDSMFVDHLSDGNTPILPERFRLTTACSPHEAAMYDDVQLRLDHFRLPGSHDGLIIEGAGGLFVPLNSDELMIDLIEFLQVPVVLVCSEYLGCINHSLLSFYTLNQRKIPVDFVVFNGIYNELTRKILKAHLPTGSGLIEVPRLTEMTFGGIEDAIKEIQITTYGEN